MRTILRTLCLAAALASAALPAARAQSLPGATVDSLLLLARERNPELAGMRHEASAARERAAVAGALPDPTLRVEWDDITMRGEQNPTLSPSRVMRTRYQFMQELPWFGKRGLEREMAGAEADGMASRADAAWVDLAARIKTTFAQWHAAHQNELLAREILDLMGRMESLGQARYAGGLAPQSDAVRAQLEQTAMRNDLIMLANEKRMLAARLNMLLGRQAQAPLADPVGLRPLPDPARLDAAALEARARQRNPQLLEEEARLRGAEKSRDLAFRNRYPDVAVGIAPVQERRSVKEWEVMVEVTIPLQQESRRGKEREAEALVAAARARREAAGYRLAAELAENLSALDAARRTEAAIAGSLLPQAELALRSALAGYESGKVEFAAVLDAQRQIRLARQNRIRLQAEAQARLADIERLVGEDL